jgi:hypothetical protein
MKINIDRLCRLAGVDAGEEKRALNEASNSSLRDDHGLEGEAEHRFGDNQLAETAVEEAEEAEEAEDIKEENLDELIEVDEVMLVQELRRAKKMIAEARDSKNKKDVASLKEHNEIKRIIEEEVDSVMKELNLTGGWVYGNKKPTNSKKGRVTTSFPGIGFGK